MRAARLVKMNVRVNQPGKHMQPCRVNCFAGGALYFGGESDDLAGSNADVQAAHLSRRDHRRAADEKIIFGIAHKSRETW